MQNVEMANNPAKRFRALSKLSSSVQSIDGDKIFLPVSQNIAFQIDDIHSQLTETLIVGKLESVILEFY